MIQATPYRTTPTVAKGQERIPALPLAVKDAKATREILFDLRHFHLGDPSAKDRLEPAGADLLPALLDPFRDTSLLRYDYPLYLAPPDPERGDLGATELAYPLARWLQEGVKEFPAEAETPPILQEHWPWIDHQIRRVIQYPDGPLAMEPLLRAAGQALADHLQLAEPERRRLDQELAWLLQALPEGAQILGYGRYAALNLLIHAIRRRGHRPPDLLAPKSGPASGVSRPCWIWTGASRSKPLSRAMPGIAWVPRAVASTRTPCLRSWTIPRAPGPCPVSAAAASNGPWIP